LHPRSEGTLYSTRRLQDKYSVRTNVDVVRMVACSYRATDLSYTAKMDQDKRLSCLHVSPEACAPQCLRSKQKMRRVRNLRVSLVLHPGWGAAAGGAARFEMLLWSKNTPPQARPSLVAGVKTRQASLGSPSGGGFAHLCGPCGRVPVTLRLT